MRRVCATSQAKTEMKIILPVSCTAASLLVISDVIFSLFIVNFAARLYFPRFIIILPFVLITSSRPPITKVNKVPGVREAPVYTELFLTSSSTHNA